MMIRTIYGGLIPLCFAIPVFAGEMGHTTHDYFISISAGPSWTKPSSTQTIALQPDVVDSYVLQNLNNTTFLGNGEVFLGVQYHFFEKIQSQVGVAFYASSFAKLRGYIQVDGDPDFQNYTYQYQMNHEHIALKSKWIFEQPLHINPYVSGGIGVGFNRSYEYSITPLIFQAVPMPPFQPNTQVALSYSLGAGFQRDLSQHFAVALGYQFVSWGAGHLDPARGQTSSKGLGLNNLYTQGIEFTISYLL